MSHHEENRFTIYTKRHEMLVYFVDGIFLLVDIIQLKGLGFLALWKTSSW